MTKRHFEAIAAILALHKRQFFGNQRVAFEEMVDDLETYFQEQNPRFDRARFTRAVFEEEDEKKTEGA